MRFYKALDGKTYGTSSERRAAQRKDRETRARAQGWTPQDTRVIMSDAGMRETFTVPSKRDIDTIAASDKRNDAALDAMLKDSPPVIPASQRAQAVTSGGTQQVTSMRLNKKIRTRRDPNGTVRVTTDGNPRGKCWDCGKVTRKTDKNGQHYCGCDGKRNAAE